MIQTKLFSGLYLTKLLNSLAKPVFLVYAFKKVLFSLSRHQLWVRLNQMSKWILYKLLQRLPT